MEAVDGEEYGEEKVAEAVITIVERGDLLSLERSSSKSKNRVPTSADVAQSLLESSCRLCRIKALRKGLVFVYQLHARSYPRRGAGYYGVHC